MKRGKRVAEQREVPSTSDVAVADPALVRPRGGRVSNYGPGALRKGSVPYSNSSWLWIQLLYMACIALVGFTVLILTGLEPVVIAVPIIAVVALAANRRLDLACAFVVVTAMLSPILTVFGHSALGSYPGNIALGALTAVCLVYAWARRAFRTVSVFGLIGLVVISATLRATSLNVGSYQARQILVPVALMFCGVTMSRMFPDLRALKAAVLLLGVANIAYMAVEFVVGPMIPPQAAFAFNEVVTYHVNRPLPGNYYFFYSNDSASLLRLGGLVLNPPVTGILVGLVAVVTYWTVRSRKLATMGAVVAVAATVGTFSRAGLLLIAIGIGLPLLVNKIGRTGSIVVFLATLVAAAPTVESEGSSTRHLDGFTAALRLAFQHPLGEGFGHFGNAVRVSALTVSGASGGESLLGTLLVSTGILGVLLVILAFVTLLRASQRVGWIAWLGVGALVTAALSESAGGLSGTSGLWLFGGAAFGLSSAAHAVIPSPVRAIGGPGTPG